MSLSVQVKDYQIVKNAKLDFIEGLNVIQGPSNNGKSSILKAIKAALYTTPGTTSIRAGQGSYMVGISYNNHNVVYQKGMKESIYLVDGEKYTKFGVNTPEAVSNALNMKELVLNGNKEILNFWDQMDYPFLLDKSPVELFRFIIDSGEDDQITKTLKSLVSDRQGISKEIDQIQGSINLIDEDIDKYKTILDNSSNVIEICDKVSNMQSKVSRFRNLDLINAKVKELNYLNDKLNSYLEENNKKIDINSKYLDILSTLTDKKNKLLELNTDILSSIGTLNEINSSVDKFSKIKNIKLIDTDRYSKLIDIRKELLELISTNDSIKINKVNDFKITNEIVEKYSKLIEIKSIIYNSKSKINSLENEEKEIKDKVNKIDKFFDLIKVCPLCGRSLEEGDSIC